MRKSVNRMDIRIMKKAFLFFIVLFSPCFVLVKEINLVWLAGGPMWEHDWIHELLSEIPATIREVFDWKQEMTLDHAIIVTSYPDKAKYQQYYRAYREKGYKFGIIHLSDESYEHPRDFYEGAQFVLRNYWHKKINQRNIIAFPLGYKKDFWKNYAPNRPLPPLKDRRYNWSFAGSIKKTTREAMYAQMKRVPQFHVHEIPHFAAANSLPVDEYRELLLNSIFIPCPRGNWNLDSFRTCEALECGCIPIVEKTPFDYFAKLVGNHPFLTVNNWSEAPSMIFHLLKNPKQLEELQKRCHSFWIEYKKNLKSKINELAETLF